MAPRTSPVSTVAIEHTLLQLRMFSHGTCKLTSLITSSSSVYFQCKLFGKRLKKRENTIVKIQTKTTTKTHRKTPRTIFKT